MEKHDPFHLRSRPHSSQKKASFSPALATSSKLPRSPKLLWIKVRASTCPKLSPNIRDRAAELFIIDVPPIAAHAFLCQGNDHLKVPLPSKSTLNKHREPSTLSCRVKGPFHLKSDPESLQRILAGLRIEQLSRLPGITKLLLIGLMLHMLFQ